jgi:type III secretion system low calcium response chaperone LcrH/SycD
MPREEPDYTKVSPEKLTGAFEKVNYQVGSQIDETLKMVLDALKTGAMPKDIFEINPNTVEFFYAQAYALYNQGKYTEALYLFQMLIMMDPTQSRHALGSAACLHRLGKYEAAGQIYLLSAPLDPQNPLPHFHAADCYIKLGVFDLALFSLKKCIETCGSNAQFTLVRERSQLMLKACQERLDQEQKDYEEEQKRLGKEKR